MENFETFRKLLGPAAKDWSESDCQEAEENLRQYVALALRVFERLEHDPEAKVRFEPLTVSRNRRTINDKGRQNDSQTNNP